MKTATLKTKKNRFEASSTLASANSSTTKVKEILVPIDFSEASKKALEFAKKFAEQFDARLTLLYVVEPVFYPDFAYTPLLVENDNLVAAAEKEIAGLPARNGIPEKLLRKTLVRTGSPFREITDAARTLKMDMIIISTHGRSGLTRALLGSTTERVVRHAHCPVLVVRA
jgi:nucleotide-binding universal stress UspA family protein